MKRFFSEFKKFMTRGNIVDMAIGVAVASAFTAIVTAFTKGFVAPLIALLTGESTLAEWKWILRPEVVDPATEEVVQAEVALLPGVFVQAAIDFLIVATFLFILMHTLHRLSERAKRLAEEIRIKTDEEYEAKLVAEREAAEQARIAEEEAAAAAAAEAAAKEQEIERLRYREIELLEQISAALAKKGE